MSSIHPPIDPWGLACRAMVAALVVSSGLAAAAAERHVWFGTGTRGQSKSEGIYVATFDDASGTLGTPRLAGRAVNPSFLALHPSLPILYAVAEVPDVDGKPGGGVAAFSIDEASFDASLLPEGSRTP